MILKKSFWLVSASLLLLVIFLPGYTKLQELRDRNRDLEEKNNRLTHENLVLEQELERIAKDTFYQEKILREKMGVVRKNEVPVKVITE
ncbi:MAG: hypothetical protein C4540_07240 [Candidatus Omnitrophota bacterium]|jgi:cell division protein FtsB|nr:MAG: hypothetical protein C4540_07240 [Candidatus Omnitrophota bacterium]